MVIMTNEEYHKDERVSSSLLKAALISKAHLEQYLNGKRKKTDAIILGTAIHTYYLENKRFKEQYRFENEIYKRAYGDFKAGDPKIDEDGEPITSLICPDGSKITGENLKRFRAMTQVLDTSDIARSLRKDGEVETSWFTETERARPDLITSDDWVVDLKTVSGTTEMPLEPKNFAREFWRMGYDLQMFMYRKILRENGYNPKGFIFLCVDAKVPSGVRAFYFENDSDWFEYGEQRYALAWKRYKEWKATGKSEKYETETVRDLPLCYDAIDELAKL